MATRNERVTIAEVAQAAGVSKMSVSLAFQPESRLSDATRRNVLAVAERLGYVPNPLARQLRNGCAEVIGFVVHDIGNPFHAQMLKRVEAFFAPRNLDVFVGNSNGDPRRECTILRNLATMKVRGVLLCGCDDDPIGRQVLAEANIPCIAIDSEPADCGDMARVVNDFDECGRLMAKHFLAIGVRRPGYVGRSTLQALKRIFTSFEDEFKRNGIIVEPRNRTEGGITISDGAAAWHALQKQKMNADAIFCLNDLCALGLLSEASRQGIKIGRDLAVAGIDDLDLSALPALDLTSIRQPFNEIADRAAMLLAELIDGEKPRQTNFVLPQTLQIRGSTARFQPED